MANREMALVIHDGVQALDVAEPLDVFAAANDFLPEEDHYRCLLVGKQRAPVRSSNGMWMTADLTFDEADRVFDTVLVAGGPALPVRIDHARNLLEATELVLKAIAFDCGFASPDQMRSAFQRRLGVTPLRYRESFKAA